MCEDSEITVLQDLLVQKVLEDQVIHMLNFKHMLVPMKSIKQVMFINVSININVCRIRDLEWAVNPPLSVL